ncbi:MAG TPA: phosphopantetheine-binding protein [Steroidobacteraceae bacterium]|nr:phosphopantetheine-binding protein [Steroidobacteraceae bacterium]
MSHEEDTTFERLRQILTKEFEVAPELIQPTARMDQLAIDSLAVIEVIFRLEDEFKISFPQQPGNLQTVGDLVSCVDRLTTEQRARASSGAQAP